MARKPRQSTDTSNMGKAEKFSVLANKRVSKVLAQLKNLKRLANTRNYEFNQKQADRVRSALADATNETCDAFDIALKGGVNVTQAATFDINAKE